MAVASASCELGGAAVKGHIKRQRLKGMPARGKSESGGASVRICKQRLNGCQANGGSGGHEAHKRRLTHIRFRKAASRVARAVRSESLLSSNAQYKLSNTIEMEPHFK